VTASLAQQLTALGLHAVASELDDFVARATQKRWGPVEVITHVAELEIAERARRSVERRMKRSRLGRFKPMADFEWNWPTRIDRDAVEGVVNLDFLPDKRNVVLVAAQGLGKTMVAQNIAHQAVQKGHTALFITASQMLLDLCSQDSARALERRLKHYERPTVLCIDEVGYLPYDARNADLLFQVVSRRYRRSLWCSPPTSPSATGHRPSRTRPAPPRSSTASSTTQTSSPSRASPTAVVRLRSTPRSPSPGSSHADLAGGASAQRVAGD